MSSSRWFQIGLGLGLAIGLGLLLTILLVLFFRLASAHSRQPLAEIAGSTLFQQPGLPLTLECGQDLLDFSAESTFDFYEYSVSAPIQVPLGLGSPLPPLQYDNHYLQGLLGRDSLGWQSTPVRVQDALITNSARFRNLENARCNRRFVQQQYLQRPGNYYAYFGAFPIGSFLYVWVPAEQRLFLIRKRG
jgi:hypothetical protein